jgi:hypothetical protein
MCVKDGRKKDERIRREARITSSSSIVEEKSLSAN